MVLISMGEVERLNPQMGKWGQLDHFITIKVVLRSPVGSRGVVTKKWKTRAMQSIK